VKSTVAKLVARLHDPQAGAVRTNGIDLRQTASKDLRSLVTIMPQDVFLFADTIRESIRYGDPKPDDAAVVAAARRTQAHAFIEKLPEARSALVRSCIRHASFHKCETVSLTVLLAGTRSPISIHRCRSSDFSSATIGW